MKLKHDRQTTTPWPTLVHHFWTETKHGLYHNKPSIHNYQ